MTAASQTPAGTGSSARWRLVFLAALAAGWLLLALLPSRVTAKIGLADNGVWFLDSYALLAASDAVQAGLDPSRPNPLDVYGRPHSYSSWWFLLGPLGLSRADNPLLGGLVVGIFAGAVVFLLRPRNGRQTVQALLAVLSPVVLLAFNRANNDLVVFALLAVGWLALRLASPAAWLLAAAAIVVATGLKFYPVLAAGAFLVLPGRRERGWALVLTALASAFVLWTEWDWFRRAVIPVSEGVYLFGAPLWWRGFGLGGWVPVAVTFMLLVLAALALNRRGWCQGLATADGPLSERAAFAAGAMLLGGCWLAGISFAYRWVFALLLLPWLWRRAEDRSARLTLGLLLVNLWADGLFCLASNLGLGPMRLEELRRWQHGYQLFAQPLVAGLMALLLAWIWPLAGLLRPTGPAIRWPAASSRWLVLGALLGWMVYVQSDRLRLAVGLPNSETWFLDSYAVLAASDAHHAGLDAAAAGVFDPLGRPHRYSDWWYGLASLGLTRGHNFVFGLACVAAALAALVATVRTADWRLAGWSLLVLLSPSFFLGLNRANNDLVVFGLLGLALAALRRNGPGWHVAAALACALATGLKFYPVVVALPLFVHHARAGRWKTAWASAAAVGCALLAVWPQMVRGRFPVEVSVHVWGGAIWPQDLGGGPGTMVLLLLGLAGGAVWWALRPKADGPRTDVATAGQLTPLLFAATVLLACFVAGLNYGYRWMFAIWLGPWLQARLQADPVGGERRLLLGVWVLVPLVLWLDGLLCLAVNSGGLVVTGMDHGLLQHGWRLLTQPLHWLLMGGLAAVAGRELWREWLAVRPGRRQ